ncbi:uncharacterized protein BO97DRAFT_414983 [Aspergillus homomorphus CBS 101889]|uniref:Uncharacterized protein n=1 Tax=Aspergillus homomorphus (strain CBS 101889) TaxID=1450537 RepID=A0A395HXZ2_ASPHC|nr:hypothetical protein BO97DRAFT_414983 [Aspergillus homomorphus CBS 101889]RAL11728.1 hypothetical protein BO97DRAFT_414983 [Aspergillus homomorphus CBS 101889]
MSNCQDYEHETVSIDGFASAEVVEEQPKWLRLKPYHQLPPRTKPKAGDLEIVPPPTVAFPVVAPTSPELESWVSYLLHRAGIRCVLCGQTAMSIMGVSIRAHQSEWAIPQADLGRAAEVLRQAGFPSCPAEQEQQRECAVVRSPSNDAPLWKDYPMPAYHFHTDHLYRRHRGDPDQGRGICLYPKRMLISNHYPDPPIGPASHPHGPGCWYEEHNSHLADVTRVYMTTDDSSLPIPELGFADFRGRQSSNHYPVYMLARHHHLENLARLEVRDRHSSCGGMWWKWQLVLCVKVLIRDAMHRYMGWSVDLSDVQSTAIRDYLEALSADNDSNWAKSRLKRVCRAIEGESQYFMYEAKKSLWEVLLYITKARIMSQYVLLRSQSGECRPQGGLYSELQQATHANAYKLAPSKSPTAKQTALESAYMF